MILDIKKFENLLQFYRQQLLLKQTNKRQSELVQGIQIIKSEIIRLQGLQIKQLLKRAV